MSLHGLSTLQMQFAQFCGDERNSFPELRVFPKFTAFFFVFFFISTRWGGVMRILPPLNALFLLQRERAHSVN